MHTRLQPRTHTLQPTALSRMLVTRGQPQHCGHTHRWPCAHNSSCPPRNLKTPLAVIAATRQPNTHPKAPCRPQWPAPHTTQHAPLSSAGKQLLRHLHLHQPQHLLLLTTKQHRPTGPQRAALPGHMSHLNAHTYQPRAISPAHSCHINTTRPQPQPPASTSHCFQACCATSACHRQE